MKRLLAYLFLVLGLGSVFNVNAEAESFKLGVCPEIELVKEYSTSSNLYHKVYKGKSLSKIKEKLKCEAIIVDKDTSYDFYMAIISNWKTPGSFGENPWPFDSSIVLIRDKKFSKLKREYLTTGMVEIKIEEETKNTEVSTKNIFGICLTTFKGFSGTKRHKLLKGKSLSKMEKKLKCEALFVDKAASPELYNAILEKIKMYQSKTGIDEIPFKKIKKKFGILDSTTGMVEIKIEEETKNTEAESNKLGICPKSHVATFGYYHLAYQNKSLSVIKKKLKCDSGAEPIIVDKDVSYDFYNAIVSKLTKNISKNYRNDTAYQKLKHDSSSSWIHKEKFSKLKREYLTTEIAEIKIEEEKKKKELLLAQKKEDTEEKPKNYLKTKEDLEAFMIGKEIEMDGVVDGKNYTWVNKYHSGGVAYSYSQGMEVEMIWEAVNGNTFKEGQAGWIKRHGWITYVLDYDNSTYLATRSKDSYNQGKYFKGNILSPEFPKKPNEEELLLAQKQKKLEERKAEAEKRKKLAEKKIEEEKRKIAEKKKKLEDERTAIVRWEGYSDMIVGTLNFSETDYEGTINLDLPNNEGTCKGSCSLQPDGKGTWQISCTNNMGAAGTLEWEEGVGITGIGRDYNDKKVKFAASAKS